VVVICLSLNSHACATLFVISDTKRQPLLEALRAWIFAQRASLFLRPAFLESLSAWNP
jgi:hypothetical protein